MGLENSFHTENELHKHWRAFFRPDEKSVTCENQAEKSDWPVRLEWIDRCQCVDARTRKRQTMNSVWILQCMCVTQILFDIYLLGIDYSIPQFGVPRCAAAINIFAKLLVELGHLTRTLNFVREENKPELIGDVVCLRSIDEGMEKLHSQEREKKNSKNEIEPIQLASF